jgi:hypothetical protein
LCAIAPCRWHRLAAHKPLALRHHEQVGHRPTVDNHRHLEDKRVAECERRIKAASEWIGHRGLCLALDLRLAYNADHRLHEVSLHLGCNELLAQRRQPLRLLKRTAERELRDGARLCAPPERLVAQQVLGHGVEDADVVLRVPGHHDTLCMQVEDCVANKLGHLICQRT